MTVTYIQDVHTAGKVGTFMRLLSKWKGSVAKGIWRDLLLFLVMYSVISVTYRVGMSHYEPVKIRFEKFCIFLNKFGEYIPLGFILGFYVTQVVNRWWTQVMTIPWIDGLCMNMASYMPGTKLKKTRRLITRWAMLANILTLRRISIGVLERFPTYGCLVKTGLMTDREMVKLEKLDKITEGLHATAWYPIQWAQASLRKVKEEGSISDLLFQELQRNLQDISSGNGTLLMYAWVNIPLVYTQLVTIVVHVYFFVTLFSRQYLHPTRYMEMNGEFEIDKLKNTDSVNLVGYDDSLVDFYVPIFTILQFIFYFGWLKVAETLINPFGNDDEDIDVNYIIDRNFQIGYLMVSADDDDEESEEDTFGDSIPPASLPHTVSSYKNKESAPVLPTDNLHLSEDAMKLNNPEHPLFSQIQNATPTRRASVASNDENNHTTIEMVSNRLSSLNDKKEDDVTTPLFNGSAKEDSEGSK